MLVNNKMCHVVQIGTDDSVFTRGRDTEFVRRQILYGELLAEDRPGSIITLVILTPDKHARQLQVGNVTFKPLIVNLHGLSKFDAWLNLYLTLRQLDRERPIDVITTQTVHDEAWIALWFAIRQQRAIVGQIHYDIFNPYTRAALARTWIGQARYVLTLHWLKRFTALRVVGRGIANEILKRNLHSRVSVIPVTMALLAQKVPQANQKQKLAKVLYVGRLVEQKNLATWIEIAERVSQAVPEANFEIVGDGKLRAELEALVVSKGLQGKVKFAGNVDYNQLSAIYQSAAVFLFTSLSEGFGRVVAEALANRVPVVAFQIAGVEDIVMHGRSGFLYPPSDVAGMVDGVIDLLRNPTLAAEMGQRGRESVLRDFDPLTLARNWVQLLIEQMR